MGFLRRTLAEKHKYRDAFGAGISDLNTEMLIHHMNSAAKPNFSALLDDFQAANDSMAVVRGTYEVVVECLKHGAKFEVADIFGTVAFGAYLFEPKEYQFATDVRILDLLHQNGYHPDVNSTCHAEHGIFVHLYNLIWMESFSALLQESIQDLYWNPQRNPKMSPERNP